MSWVVVEDTPTATVIYMAAKRIGKAQNHEQLQKICDYLVNKHWFQTAGDLRSARQESPEWQALEVPARLKLAIQQVLDQTNAVLHEHVPAYGYEEYYAAVAPSDDSISQEWDQSTGAAEAASPYYTGTFDYSHTTVDPATQYSYEYSSTYDASAYTTTSQSGHGNYYDVTSQVDPPPAYHESEAALLTLADVSTRESEEQVHSIESDVVEAHAIEVDDCVEGPLVQEESDGHTVELAEPTLDVGGGTWSCGQCTFLNAMTESFCEMCVGHISLSPDVKTAAGTSASATLLVPAKPVVEMSFIAASSEASPPPYSPQPGTSLLLPPFNSQYLASAPEFEDDTAMLPPPPPYPAPTCSNDVDFLALAFSGSSASKAQVSSGLQTEKSSQMRREEATTFTEYTF